MYKIEVYLPPEVLDDFILEMDKINVATIGKYKHCMTWYGVTSSWMPEAGAKPYRGTPNVKEIADEYKIEFICDERKLKTIIQHIKQIHPYETPCINVIQLIDFETCK